ncbi:hypothetical protein JOB18_013165 [Solea senegalensis]|uniref:Uncharacterized protein n=1 Tax=Solea senegalensis TaxID=28829 RepID=A0AAV6Q195_SOLSE|nr:hypothetical protein JOB18_013165 [Solea senegalensis]
MTVPSRKIRSGCYYLREVGRKVKVHSLPYRRCLSPRWALKTDQLEDTHEAV